MSPGVFLLTPEKGHIMRIPTFPVATIASEVSGIRLKCITVNKDEVTS